MSAADGVAGTSMSSTAVGESAVTFAFSAETAVAVTAAGAALLDE